MESIQNHLRSEIGRHNPCFLDRIKQYGKALKKDEYAFLRIYAEKATYETQPESQCDDMITTVFKKLYDILAYYESSRGFNCIPGTDNSDGAWSYFESEIDKAKNALMEKFIVKQGSEADYQKLKKIINETEIFVKSYSVPGVVKRWREINPQINYFHCVFDILEEYGIETARQLYCEGLLNYFPTITLSKHGNVIFLILSTQMPMTICSIPRIVFFRTNCCRRFIRFLTRISAMIDIDNARGT